MKTILAATDLSLRSERALRRAFALAKAHGAALRILNVVDDDMPEELAARRRFEGEAELARLCAALPGGCDVDWSARAVLGDPTPAVLAEADAVDADLVVTGIPRARSLLGDFAGTTVERLCRVSLRPVLLVSRPAEFPYETILTGLDLSPAAAAAVRDARALAPTARITGFHAVHVPYAGLDVAGERNGLGGPFMRLASSDLEAWIAATGLRASLDDVRLEEGGLTVVFLRLMEELKPQLVAIGAHGRGSLNPTLLGHFAAGLLRDPPCDLLVVRR